MLTLSAHRTLHVTYRFSVLPTILLVYFSTFFQTFPEIFILTKIFLS